MCKSPGAGTHFGAKAQRCQGGMVTGQIDTCIKNSKPNSIALKISSHRKSNLSEYTIQCLSHRKD